MPRTGVGPRGRQGECTGISSTALVLGEVEFPARIGLAARNLVRLGFARFSGVVNWRAWGLPRPFEQLRLSLAGCLMVWLCTEDVRYTMAHREGLRSTNMVVLVLASHMDHVHCPS